MVGPKGGGGEASPVQWKTEQLFIARSCTKELAFKTLPSHVSHTQSVVFTSVAQNRLSPYATSEFLQALDVTTAGFTKNYCLLRHKLCELTIILAILLAKS